jgi:hypothetical protein
MVQYQADPTFQLSLIVYKTIHDVLSNNVVSISDIHHLVKGQKLSFGKAVVEYDHQEVDQEKFGGSAIFFLVRRDKISKKCPTPYVKVGLMTEIAKVPLLRKAVDTASISTEKVYREEKEYSSNYTESFDDPISKLRSLRGLQSAAIVYVGPSNVPNKIKGSLFLGSEPILSTLSIMRSAYSGALKSLDDTAYNPQIVLAVDPAAAVNVVEKNTQNFSPKWVVIDGATFPDLSMYIDDIAELRRKGIQVLYLAPQNERVNLDPLKDAGFRALNLADSLYQSEELFAEEPTQSARSFIESVQKRSVDFLECKADEVVNCYSIMKKYDSVIDEPSYPAVAKNCFESFQRLFFSELRRCTPNDDLQEPGGAYATWKERVSRCRDEALFIANTEFLADMERVDGYLDSLCSRPVCHKEALLQQFFKTHQGDIALVVHGGAVVDATKTFYQQWLFDAGITTAKLAGVFSDDGGLISGHFDHVVICGWFRKDEMRRILLSNVAPHYSIMVHRCEESWSTNGINEINSRQENLSGVANPELTFLKASKAMKLAFAAPDRKLIDPKDVGNIYEKFRERRYADFKKAVRADDFVVKATLLVFNDGSAGCFTEFYTFQCINELLSNPDGRIIAKNPEELSIGDVVAFFVSSHDKIKELADAILAEEGMPTALTTATLWRQTLLMQRSAGLSDQDIYNALVAHGLKISFQAVRKWINYDDSLKPRDPNDLDIIARTFHDPELSEKLDEVKNMGTIVTSAHVSAGFKLASLFYQDQKFQEIIKEYSSSQNAYLSAKTINVANVGEVNLLTVIDKGRPEDFVYSKTNKMKKEVE